MWQNFAKLQALIRADLCGEREDACARTRRGISSRPVPVELNKAAIKHM